MQTWNHFLALIRNGVYVGCTLTISCLYFIVTGLQFWVSDYMLMVVGIDPTIIFPTYVVVTITAPTFGILTGGALGHKIGGYTSKNALNLCMLLGLCAVLVALPMPFIRSFIPFIVLLWLLLFFGAGIMPNMTGIMISSVRDSLRYKANALSQVVSNLLGYLPSPFLYGLICSLTGGDESPYGMLVILYWSFFALGFAVIAFLSKRTKSTVLMTPLMRKFRST